SASLVTPDAKGVTNATLFNTAGMQPLVPYLLGKLYKIGDHESKRLADVQKCLRTVDLDEVGDATHATFFEMLGNWSLGDYFKKDAIEWSYAFLTSKDEGLGLDPKRLYITVFEGDANAPRDEEAAGIWREIFKRNGIEGERIFYMSADKNWWEAGDNGPCGPDTEMYYDIGDSYGGKGLTREQFIQGDDSRKIVEVWNDVFMQYEKKDGKVIGKLAKPSVDTGAGLERLAMTLQGVDNIYDTDLLKPVMDLMAAAPNELKNKRVIADHLRASVFLIADGVVPSNTDRGYILRRLIRRAVTNTTDKKLDMNRIDKIVETIISIYKDAYPELGEKKEAIKKVLEQEAAKFTETLAIGTKEFESIAKKGAISGEDAFKLFSSYGLPIDVTKAMAAEKGLNVDIRGYDAEFKKHQELSRAGAEQKFKGGLADANDPMVVRYHTATHLLHQALHDVLGDSVMQKGSNITAERLRFDFAHGAKMTDDEKKRVEEIVNRKIGERLPVNRVIMPKSEAEKTGARHFFGDKYGDDVSIYFIGDDLGSAYSKEFCGGPHVKNIGELAGPEGKWRFKIQKEEAVAQGVRRIKAVLS
ncbi:MAG: alanine--tRNA ligase, partial [Patescibacteria group bacterium]|nr:alanine--tRNA ligase [Patescibacteria group bacterium]